MSVSKHILVTGANGQLGMEIRDLASGYPDVQWHFHDRDSLSITDKPAVHHYCREHGITHIVNCAAYTAVDLAEQQTEAAFAVNAEGPAILAEVSAELGIILIHISTDYVFDGSSSAPYRENDAVCPENVYGASKLSGEEKIRQVSENAIIIRTSWVFGKYGKNFVKTMMRLMKEKDHVRVVNDQQGCPTYAADLASAILHIISMNVQPKPGIYHYCNEGITNWYAFAKTIRDITGSTCVVEPIPSSAFPTPARRPKYSVLDTSLIRHTFGLQIPHWKDSLADCIRRLG